MLILITIKHRNSPNFSQIFSFTSRNFPKVTFLCATNANHGPVHSTHWEIHFIISQTIYLELTSNNIAPGTCLAVAIFCNFLPAHLTNCTFPHFQKSTGSHSSTANQFPHCGHLKHINMCIHMCRVKNAHVFISDIKVLGCNSTGNKRNPFYSL